MSATEVIRLHADLRDRLRDRDFREWAWANMTKLRTMPEDVGWHVVDLMTGHAAVAADFYVTAPMMAAVFRRAQDLPDDLPQIAADPPSSFGFLVFEEPLRWTNGYGREETVSTLLWGTGTLLEPVTVKGETVPGLRGRIITGWTRLYDEEQQFIAQELPPEGREWARQASGAWYFSLIGGMWDGDPLGPLFPTIESEDSRYRGGRLAAAQGREPTQDSEITVRNRMGPLRAPDGCSINFARVIAALWSLMNETIPGSAAIDRRTPEDRPTRRLAHRMGLPGEVSVIRLRREEERVHGIETGRTVGVRYHVEGFWRTLYRGTPRERQVWVHEHWRGPENAPLSMRQTVRVLAR